MLLPQCGLKATQHTIWWYTCFVCVSENVSNSYEQCSLISDEVSFGSLSGARYWDIIFSFGCWIFCFIYRWRAEAETCWKLYKKPWKRWYLGIQIGVQLFIYFDGSLFHLYLSSVNGLQSTKPQNCVSSVPHVPWLKYALEPSDDPVLCSLIVKWLKRVCYKVGKNTLPKSVLWMKPEFSVLGTLSLFEESPPPPLLVQQNQIIYVRLQRSTSQPQFAGIWSPNP